MRPSFPACDSSHNGLAADVGEVERAAARWFAVCRDEPLFNEAVVRESLRRERL
jgi:hypothetical protein